MRVVNLTIAVLLAVLVVGIVFLTFQIGLVGLHICCNMMRLQVVLIFHDKHVIICHQMICLIWNRIVQLIVILIIAVIVLLG